MVQFWNYTIILLLLFLFIIVKYIVGTYTFLLDDKSCFSFEFWLLGIYFIGRVIHSPFISSSDSLATLSSVQFYCGKSRQYFLLSLGEFAAFRHIVLVAKISASGFWYFRIRVVYVDRNGYSMVWDIIMGVKSLNEIYIKLILKK